MGLIKDLLFGYHFSEAKRLLQNGYYRECIKFIDDNISFLHPSSVVVEDWWIQSQCYYRLREFNSALHCLNLIINYPEDSDVSPFQSEARRLQKEIVELQANQPVETVKYPNKPFLDYVVKKDFSKEIKEREFEGLSERYGTYYIRNTFGMKNDESQYTIYIEPISDTRIYIFVYMDFILKLKTKEEEDSIGHHVIMQKLPLIKSLFEKGKNGPSSSISFFATTDWGQSTTIRHKIPVLGKTCDVQKNSNLELSSFESEIKSLYNMAYRVECEYDEARITNSDKAKMAILAFTKGALDKVASKEIGDWTWNVAKIMFNNLKD